MRLNRKTRIGATIVAVTLLLLGLSTIFRSWRGSNSAPTQVAGSAQPTAGGANTVAVPASAGTVAVAREDIPERAIVTPDMLELRRAPAGFDTAAFVTNPEAQAVGFIAARPILRGKQIRRADFLGHISDVGIAGALLPGRRAMIIPIGNKATLHDLVRIGDHVDIVASFEQQEARTVAEDVRVLAVDVFGSDYPQVKIAMRGDYKAPVRSVSAAVPPSPASGQSASAQSASGQSNPDAPAGQQPPSGAAPQPGASAAAPEPTPTQGPPPARPEAAMTIEVTPQQATDIALTQSAGQNLDFLLRPRSEPGVVAGAVGPDGLTLVSGTARSAAFTTRDRLAPYAARVKRAGAASTAGAAAQARKPSPARISDEASPTRRGHSRAGGSLDFTPPPLPDVRSIPPANPGGAASIDFSQKPPPATYDIPVYGDGKLVRTDTVRRPAGS